jgi:hypothetical protein
MTNQCKCRLIPPISIGEVENLFEANSQIEDLQIT